MIQEPEDKAVEKTDAVREQTEEAPAETVASETALYWAPADPT